MRALLAGMAGTILIGGVEATLAWANWTPVGNGECPSLLHTRVVYSLIPVLGSAAMVLAVMGTRALRWFAPDLSETA